MGIPNVERRRNWEKIPGKDGGELLQAEKFTKHMQTKTGEGNCPKITAFRCTPSMVESIQEAIKKAPKRKTEGRDKLFVEVLQIEAETCAIFLAKVWEACSRMKHTLRDWNTAILVPLHKKGDPTVPSNYRPISILTHARKIIEAAISMEIRKEYQFHPTQLGFQQGTGTETAIVRHVANAQHAPYAAILDLKQAYDSVPRNILMEVVTRKLKENPAHMVALTLQKIDITTNGDEIETRGTISRGVTQGSPLSPTLFNLYMDTLSVDLDQTKLGPNRERLNWTLFADDFKMQAKTPQHIQRGLEGVETWAVLKEMKWSPPKCFILEPPGRKSEQAYRLNEHTIQTLESAEYLGVTASWKGVEPDKSIRRITQAKKIAIRLYRHGIHERSFNNRTMIRIVKTFIMPKATYGLHLTDFPPTLQRAWGKLHHSAITAALGWYSQGRDKTMRTITQLPTLLQLIATRQAGMEERLKKRATSPGADYLSKEDPTMFPKLRNAQQPEIPKLTKTAQEKGWITAARTRARKIPI